MKADKIIKDINLLPKDICELLEINIRKLIQGNEPPRTGRHYKGNPRPSSAPGEPPASQTGNLVNNSNLRTEKIDKDWYVILTAEYAKNLEFGGKNMAPRPFILPSINKTINQLNKKK